MEGLFGDLDVDSAPKNNDDPYQAGFDNGKF